MYAKTLVLMPTGAIPMIAATTSALDVLASQLLSRGWGPFDGRSAPAGSGHLTVSHDRLQLLVDGQVLLDDLNPAAPDGWWAAVDGFAGRCVVVVVATGRLDLTRPDVGGQMVELMDEQAGVWAVLPIEHGGFT